MTRWEYTLVGGGEVDALRMLNEKGEQGWECFVHETTVDGATATHWFWLKRPMPEEPAGITAAAEIARLHQIATAQAARLRALGEVSEADE